jgi:hypothetical protein
VVWWSRAAALAVEVNRRVAGVGGRLARFPVLALGSGGIDGRPIRLYISSNSGESCASAASASSFSRSSGCSLGTRSPGSMIRRLWGRWEGASELLRAAAKQCLYRHTGRILNPKRSGLLGSLGPADRSRRGRRRCYCRQKDKIPHTTEYFPDARSDRRRSNASCLYPADCVCPPGSPVSTADLVPTLTTAAPLLRLRSKVLPSHTRRDGAAFGQLLPGNRCAKNKLS